MTLLRKAVFSAGARWQDSKAPYFHKYNNLKVEHTVFTNYKLEFLCTNTKSRSLHARLLITLG